MKFLRNNPIRGLKREIESSSPPYRKAKKLNKMKKKKLTRTRKHFYSYFIPKELTCSTLLRKIMVKWETYSNYPQNFIF